MLYKCMVKTISVVHRLLSVRRSGQRGAVDLESGCAVIIYMCPGHLRAICGRRTLTFRPKTGENVNVDYIKLEEGDVVNGEWKPGRVMNEDEKMSLQFGDMPTCYVVEVYKY